MEQVAVEVIKEWGLIGIIIVVISAVCAFLGYLYYTERKNNSSNNNSKSPNNDITAVTSLIQTLTTTINDKLDDKLDNISDRFDLLEDKFNNKIDILNDRVENKLKTLEMRINNIPKENMQEIIKREDELAEAERKLHQKALDDIMKLGDEIYEILNEYTEKINCTHLFVGSFHNGSSSLQGLPYIKFNIIREAYHQTDTPDTDHPFAPVYRDCDLSLLGKLPQMLVQNNLIYFSIDENNQSDMFKYDGCIVRRMIGMGIKQIALHTLREPNKEGKLIVSGFVGIVKYNYDKMDLDELKKCVTYLEHIHNKK